jgi:copper chaperone CopZ
MSGDANVLVVAVGGMHCPSCGLLIDEVVEELPGVASSTTDVRAGRTVVRPVVDGGGATLDPVVVLDAIRELGYSAATTEDDAISAGGTG